MPHAFVPLDPGSEMLALSTFGNTRNLIVTAIDLQGPFNEDAVAHAARRVVQRFPQLRSRLHEYRRNGLYRLAWEPGAPEEFPVVVSPFVPTSGDTPDLAVILAHLSPWLDTPWDLFRRVPAEMHIITYAENRRVVAVVVHHAAADAVVSSEFGKAALLEYQKLVTGTDVDSAVPLQGLSTSRKRQVNIKKNLLRDLIAKARLAISPLLERPVLPVGSGDPGDSAQHHIKRVLSEAETASMVATALKNGQSLLDLLMVCTNLAVDRWNERHNVRPGLVTTSVTVNMRGRFEGIDNPNNASILVFKSTPEQRSDPKELARAMALARIKLLRNQMDRRFHSNIAFMNDSVRVLPFHVRRRIVHFIVEQHQFSVAVTLLGAIWPKIRNGRPSLESDLTEVGELKVTEVHGVGYKLLSRTRILFIVYAFRNRINVVLAASGCLFTRDEAESFMDLTLEILRELSVPSQ